jgi:hypothetical protein
MAARLRLRRRLTLRDVMVLMLMLGAGMAWLRGLAMDGLMSPGFRPRPSLLAALRRDVVGPLLPCGLVWTLAVLLLRFGHPRPSRRYLARQPGTVACVAAASVAIAGAASLVLVMAARFYAGVDDIVLTDRFMTRFMEAIAPSIGTGVLVAWAMMALNGMWRPEPSWVDRWGRAMGAFWVAMIPIFAWSDGRLIL